MPVAASVERLDVDFNLTTARERRKRPLSVLFANTEEEVSNMKKFPIEETFRTIAWLIIGDPGLLRRSAASPFLPLDNQVMFATVRNSTTLTSSLEVVLYDVYQAADYLDYVIDVRGSWSEVTGLRLDTLDTAEKRTNLTGLHFRCVTLPQAPFIYLTEGPPGEETEISHGFAKDVWDTLQRTFNFTYSCRRPYDLEFGRLKDGEWTGLIGTLTSRMADVAVTAVDHTPDRAAAVQFLQGLRTVGSRLVVRRPGYMDSTWTSFTSEMDLGSWLLTIAMVLLIPPLIVFISSHSPSEDQKLNLNDAYIFTLGAIAFQGPWRDVTGLSSRVAFLTVFMGGLLVYYHYTSALTAHLTIASSVEGKITSLSDVISDPLRTLGFLQGSSLQSYFNDSKVPVNRDIWHRLLEPNVNSMPTTHQQGIDKVTRENFFYLMEYNMFNFEFYDQCAVMMLKMNLFTAQAGFAFPKKSPFVRTFDLQLTKMRASGLLERYWRRWQPPSSLCEAVPLVALSIEQTFTAFLVLLLGIAISLFVCLPAEKVCHMKQKNTAQVGPLH